MRYIQYKSRVMSHNSDDFSRQILIYRYNAHYLSASGHFELIWRIKKWHETIFLRGKSKFRKLAKNVSAEPEKCTYDEHCLYVSDHAGSIWGVDRWHDKKNSLSDQVWKFLKNVKRLPALSISPLFLMEIGK